MPSRHPREMTFGIELEFLAFYPEQTFSYLPGPNWDKTCSQALHRLLAARGIPVTGGIGEADSDDDDGEDIFGDDGPSYSKWVIQAEGGLHLDESEEAALGEEGRKMSSEESIEICSRKFSLERDDWRREVRIVLEAMQELRKLGVVFVANATTGLHVHIGYGDAGVPLEAAKGVLQVALAFENKLDTLYTAPRIAHPDGMKRGHFNAPLSWTFANNPQLQGCRGNLLEWLECIAARETIEEIGELFVLPRPEAGVDATIDGHYSVLNFDNLFDGPRSEGPPKGTVEFRQHPGTLDYNDITAHVELCATMRARSPIEFGVLNLLATMGCRRQLIEFYRARNSSATQELRRSSSQKFAAQIASRQIVGLRALDAQVTIGRWERASAVAIGRAMALKKQNGSYGRV